MTLNAVDVIVGGLNVFAGLASISAAASNCLLYNLTMRLVGIVVILFTSGFIIILFELFPRPSILRRNASHLTSYQGRALHYLMLTLLSTDSVRGGGANRIFLLWSWISGGIMALIAVIFVLLGLYSALSKNALSLPKSMKKRARSTNHQHELIKDNDNESLELEKAASHGKRTTSFNSMSSPICDPFGRVPSDQTSPLPSWPARHSPSLQALPNPNQTSPSINDSAGMMRQLRLSDSKFQEELQSPTSTPLCSPSSPRNGMTALRQSTRPSTANSTKSTKSTKSGKRNLLGLYSHSPPAQETSNASSNHQRRSSVAHSVRYETTQERLGNQDGVEWSTSILQQTTNPDANNYHRQLTFEAASDSKIQDGDMMVKKGKSSIISLHPKRTLSRNHKRVYVPSVGTFDLSSGSESEEDGLKEKSGVPGYIAEDEEEEEEDDDDDASVYSVEEATSQSALCESGKLKLGRKLTRKETKKHQGKLNRGIQRAMSQRGLSSNM